MIKSREWIYSEDLLNATEALVSMTADLPECPCWDKKINDLAVSEQYADMSCSKTEV